MRHGLRFRHVLMGALGLVVCAFGAARGADDPPKKYKTFSFDATDGVHLSGNLWSNAGVAGQKDATVILIHNFTPQGGSSRDDGWDDLGDKLQEKGYSVFSFDFRGYGESTKIDPDKFWDLRKNPHNQKVKGFNKKPLPETINHADFQHDYYPYLVNDLIAARAFLDGRNDSGDVNTSSVFVIGAGEGATLGALWMDTEWHRQKGNLDPFGNPLVDKQTGKFSMQEPEGKDQAGAIWLSISPTLAERPLSSSAHAWVAEVGGEDRVPMAFLYGGKETKERTDFAVSCLKNVLSGYRRKNGDTSISQEEVTDKTDENLKASSQWKLPDTFKLKIGDDTTLSGNKLLTGDPSTMKLVGTILDHIMNDRKNLASKKRNNDTAAIFWTFTGALPIRAKEPMDPVMPIFDPRIEPRFMH